MKVGIMQPYFLPYIGYISLIKHTDIFILLDEVQFIRHGWIERNRILKPNEGWQYIQVPIMKPSGRTTKIKDIVINNKEDWKSRVTAQLQHYKKSAPYYRRTMLLINDILSDNYDSIVSLNSVSLQKICGHLGIDTDIKIFSEMNLQIEEANEPDDWALNICKSMNSVNEYWNPIGGREFFNKHKYETNGIDLKFHNVSLDMYNQKRDIFEPGLSVIDVLMYNTPDEINEMLDKYVLA